MAAVQAAPLQRTLGFPFCADLAPLKVDPADADMRAPRLSWNSGATVSYTLKSIHANGRAQPARLATSLPARRLVSM